MNEIYNKVATLMMIHKDTACIMAFIPTDFRTSLLKEAPIKNKVTVNDLRAIELTNEAIAEPVSLTLST